MKVSFKEGKRIVFNRELSKLDRMALLFSERLFAANIKHVFLSGYVAILFGRSRTSEDIDVVCKPISYEEFEIFWKDIDNDFDSIITTDVRNAYHNYLRKNTAVRFAYKGEIIPNVELKFASTEMHREALSKALDVVVNNRHLPISPLELQIAYKLFMGSEKDIEDARFLFKLFDDKLDNGELINYLKVLKVALSAAKHLLGWSD